MSVCVSLPEHIVFRELPFCGVLLDTRRSRVYRLSQEAAAILRQALHGADAAGPYEPVISAGSADPTIEQRAGMLRQLGSQGLVRIEGNAGVRARDDDAR